MSAPPSFSGDKNEGCRKSTLQTPSHEHGRRKSQLQSAGNQQDRYELLLRTDSNGSVRNAFAPSSSSNHAQASPPPLPVLVFRKGDIKKNIHLSDGQRPPLSTSPQPPPLTLIHHFGINPNQEQQDHPIDTSTTSRFAAEQSHGIFSNQQEQPPALVDPGWNNNEYHSYYGTIAMNTNSTDRQTIGNVATLDSLPVQEEPVMLTNIHIIPQDPPSPPRLTQQLENQKDFYKKHDRRHVADSFSISSGNRSCTSVLKDHDQEKITWQRYCHPSYWLLLDSTADDDGNLSFQQENIVLKTIRSIFYDPLNMEFTSVQQFTWACILGCGMGFFVSLWKYFIEKGIEFLWVSIPTLLLQWGVFTPLDGNFPLYHYMWICPAVVSGFLTWMFAVVPIRFLDQNDWITMVHTRGVVDPRGLLLLWALTTGVIISGLSLGPELPLVLVAGMIGSWIAMLFQQSMLQARVINLTAASAAIGGFFGFPMAGALFVLEIPHRMGLQYFEALSPATIASIVAVLTNRLVTGNDVTGYYSYPFLSRKLPSGILTSAIVYGFYGAGLGLVYGFGCLKLKTLVKSVVITPEKNANKGDLKDDGKSQKLANNSEEENIPLMSSPNHKPTHQDPQVNVWNRIQSGLTIKNDAKRAAMTGVLSGFLVGVVAMFFPHTLFWGEAQLQCIINRGRTPLPVFGQGDDPTAALTAMGFCMIDPSDPIAIQQGFSQGCALLITVAKIVTTGLSLGTGLVGGHFWGPLFVGCSASHFLTDAVNVFSTRFYGYGGMLVAHPCVLMICTMGSAHVVTFRAHMAIMLILTLTIASFNSENAADNITRVAGDYSAIFPLLVVSVFVSLMVSKNFVFYKAQRSRGDITAIPEVLCEPGMEGRPMVVDYDYDSNSEGESAGTYEDGVFHRDNDDLQNGSARCNNRAVGVSVTLNDLEAAFAKGKTPSTQPRSDVMGRRRSLSEPLILGMIALNLTDTGSVTGSEHGSCSSEIHPIRGQSTSSSGRRHGYVRITSFGEVKVHQPSLLDQARMRSASSAGGSHQHRRVNSGGDGSRGSPQHLFMSGSTRSCTSSPRSPRKNLVQLPSSPPRRPQQSVSSPPSIVEGVPFNDDNDKARQNISNDDFLKAMRESFS